MENTSIKNAQQVSSVAAEELEKLRKENHRLKRIINALMNGYTSICDANFRTLKVEFMQSGSPLIDQMLQSGKLPLWPELVAMYVQHGVFEEDRAEVQMLLDPQYLMVNLPYGSSITKEYRNNLGIYGEVRIVRISRNTVLLGFTEMDREITERKAQLYTDSLTHVKNRKYYDESLASQSCQALAIADLDLFKSINDTQGHQCGDDALAAVAAVLDSSVRDVDEVVRYGGDEFLIVFRDITQEALQNRMETLRQSIEKIKRAKHASVHLSMSFGVVFGTGLAKDMFVEADKLLYESKKTRNTVTIRRFSAASDA